MANKKRTYKVYSKNRVIIYFPDGLNYCVVDVEALFTHTNDIFRCRNGRHYKVTDYDKRNIKLALIKENLWYTPLTKPTSTQLARMKRLERRLANLVPDFYEPNEALLTAMSDIDMSEDEFRLLYPTYQESLGVYSYPHLT